MSLENNLKDPNFSRDREELINYRLFYEIKKHGLSAGVDYELFPPVIDKNGYDLLVKHGRNLKAFQIKTVAKTSKTSWWSINKKFLRPDNITDGERIISNFDAELAGLGGGVIVVEYHIINDSKIELEYYYFDYQILYFFQTRLAKWGLKKNSYYDVVSNLFSDDSKIIQLRKSLLYKTKGIKDLLNISRVEPLNNDLTRGNSKSWTFRAHPYNEEYREYHVNIDGNDRVLNINEMNSFVGILQIGERSFEAIE